MRVRPTARGMTIGAIGLVLAWLGIVVGSTGLTRIGAFGLAVLGVGAAWAYVTDPTRGRHSLRVHRTVVPNPVSVGQGATVRVVVSAHGLSERIRLAGLRLGEQAAAELSDGRPLRARVVRAIDSITVTYPIRASRRGRWALGPLAVRHTDPFAVAWIAATIGATAEVAVWPAVTELALPPGALVGEPDRVALGARSPSTDDAALRDYREGDDLRRVHWASTARRGQLLVRSDERAGMRPASVLLDLPAAADAAEWSISLAASIGLALLGAGHPVRLAGARATVRGGDPEARSHHLREGSSGSARAQLLDLTVDLHPARTPGEIEDDLVAAARLLGAPGAGSELTFAVVGPLGGSGRAAMAQLAVSGNAWAMVRTPREAGVPRRDALSTAEGLRRAGWQVAAVTVGEPIADCWRRLLGNRP